MNGGYIVIDLGWSYDKYNDYVTGIPYVATSDVYNMFKEACESGKEVRFVFPLNESYKSEVAVVPFIQGDNYGVTTPPILNTAGLVSLMILITPTGYCSIIATQLMI